MDWRCYLHLRWHYLHSHEAGHPIFYFALIGTAPCTVNWHLYHATSPIEVFSAVFTFPSSGFFAFTTLFALWLCLNLFDTAIKASAVYRNTALQYFLFVHYALCSQTDRVTSINGKKRECCLVPFYPPAHSLTNKQTQIQTNIQTNK